ncbi:Hypothetical predicted protein [Octopus vulgaris]|uniref:Uncharacterized protein n=1 Tax=Octopus vulgaris TaxID=6645 RepID=A0AA36AY50_OCTVU|nr:Hypothetical predicted protein [Octopus vulgaris]
MQMVRLQGSSLSTKNLKLRKQFKMQKHLSYSGQQSSPSGDIMKGAGKSLPGEAKARKTRALCTTAILRILTAYTNLRLRISYERMVYMPRSLHPLSKSTRIQSAA